MNLIPAKAGTSGQEVSAGLPEVPAFAGMTGWSYPAAAGQTGMSFGSGRAPAGSNWAK